MPPTVPRHAVITTNTPVSIILKQDQSTGRQVTGVVADVLTRGDHPRGVKVRLKDGRVGRVQKILDAVPAGLEASGSRSNGEGEGYVDDGYSQTEFSPRGTGGGRGRGRRDRGFGNDNYQAPAPRNGDGDERNETVYDLTAFIKDKRKGGSSRGGIQQPGGYNAAIAGSSTAGINRTSDIEAAVVRCPVCGNFEGDETAVQHHVEQHFA
ncbi:hypothetical protein ABW20_dc0102757 [Dactylellina cionopaga]|nr:hypothetical protein ABW20_dc0102757 [Dactylellina cionopaga]